MKRFVSLIILFFPFVSEAQYKIDTMVINEIKNEEMKHSEIPFLAHYLTDISGPRLTNSENFNNAAHFAMKTLSEWGMKNTELEPWGEFGKGWTLDKFYIAMKTPYYQPLLAFPYPWTGSTKGEKIAGVVLLDSLNMANIYKGDLKNKIVMIKENDSFITHAFSTPGKRYTNADLENLKDCYLHSYRYLEKRDENRQKIRSEIYSLQLKGVVAVIFTSKMNVDGEVYNLGFGNYWRNADSLIPVVSMEREDYLRLQRLLESDIPVSIDMDIKVHYLKNDYSGYNVIADIPGTDKDLKSQLVMIGAHLDSWNNATGATDNASGCAVMMEVMRIIEVLHLHPRRTIRLALWSGEEEGLLGSRHYVLNHFGDVSDMNMKLEQRNVSAYFNLDNGTGKIRGIYSQSNTPAGDIFKEWLMPFGGLGATTVANCNTGSTDHISFDEVGIPAFEFIQDPLDYEDCTHHSNMDNYDHLFLSDLKQAAIIVASFVYNTAMMDQEIPRKPIPQPHPHPYTF